MNGLDTPPLPGSMPIPIITSAEIITTQPEFHWSLTNVFTPGVSYIVAIYSRILIPDGYYSFSIIPQSAFSTQYATFINAYTDTLRRELINPSLPVEVSLDQSSGNLPIILPRSIRPSDTVLLPSSVKVK